MPRTRSLNSADLRLRIQSSGPLSAEELAGPLRVSRLTVQRAMRELEGEVVRLGITRATRYAIRRPVMGTLAQLKIDRINPHGDRNQWAELTALYGGWQVEWAKKVPQWASLITDHAGFCDGLPFFLSDLRPQGYLGRAVVRSLPAAHGLPPDIRTWSDDHTWGYLMHHGHDAPGNLVIGERASTSFGAVPEAVLASERHVHYPRMATLADAGHPAGSSVEGEQPKFIAYVAGDGACEPAPCVVKFTDRLDRPTGRRWADLLLGEQIAVSLLHDYESSDTARPKLFDFDNRRFYEIPRFDRGYQGGRRGIVSLRSLHDAGVTGKDTTDWKEAARGLANGGWLTDADVDRIELRWHFGRLIGNSDMHFGNLAFFWGDELPFQVTPVFDMLPMLWAPRPAEALPSPVFDPKPPDGDSRLWREACQLAGVFWRKMEDAPELSDDFRSHAAAAGQAVKRVSELGAHD